MSKVYTISDQVMIERCEVTNFAQQVMLEYKEEKCIKDCKDE